MNEQQGHPLVQMTKYAALAVTLLPILVALRLVSRTLAFVNRFPTYLSIQLNLFASWFLGIGSYERRN